jgi:carotenoid cleavage dioxygenase-like enzyme
MTDQMDADQETPFWLVDNFAPVFEEFTQTEFLVTGEIPTDLNGIHLSDGRANWYRNRYVQTPLKAQSGIDLFT